MSSPAPRRPVRVSALLPLAIAVTSALVAAHAIGRDPRSALPLVGLLALALVPPLLGRSRMRRLLRSGDVERIIGTWSGSIERIAHRETMAPLLQATAYAAYGWADAAQRALSRAVRGAAWDAALEQRLFIETLLDTFWGERAAALQKAALLQLLPMPPAGPLARRRIASLRRGLSALARAFAHASLKGDDQALSSAASASPLVHWAMRYARAIVALDGGRAREIPLLLAGAPAWPEQSAFREYHRELLARAAP